MHTLVLVILLFCETTYVPYQKKKSNILMGEPLKDREAMLALPYEPPYKPHACIDNHIAVCEIT